MTVIKKQDNQGPKKALSKEERIAAAEDAFTRVQIAWENEDYPLAMQHAEKAVELMPDRGRYLNLVGAIAEKLDEHDKAINYFEQSLKSDLVRFGEGHPTLDITRNNLGIAWDSKGEHDKAIKYFKQTLKGALAAFGEGDPQVALTRNNLGNAWASKGEYDKAINYFEKALKGYIATLGEGSHRVSTTREYLAHATKKRDQANQIKKKSGPKPQ